MFDLLKFMNVYENQETVEVPMGLLRDLSLIAFDYANPEGPKYHGLPLTTKGVALNAGNIAAELHSDKIKNL